MKLMKTVLKYGITFGAGVVCTGIMFAYGAVANHEDPSLRFPGEEVLILNGNDNRQYKVVAINGVEDGSLSLATINRIK